MKKIFSLNQIKYFSKAHYVCTMRLHRHSILYFKERKQSRNFFKSKKLFIDRTL